MTKKQLIDQWKTRLVGLKLSDNVKLVPTNPIQIISN
jgi:hypothetical protein